MTSKDYTNSLIDKVYQSMYEIFSEAGIVSKTLKEHTDNKRSERFQKYYIDITGSSKFLDTPKAVGTFKAHYSLSGADEDFFAHLSTNKNVIIKFVDAYEFNALYDQFFHKVEMKNGIDKKTGKLKRVKKNQGSFFSKLIHTLKPNEYCVVDNYVRQLFKLENESYLLSMLVITEVYKKFSRQNSSVMNELEVVFKGWDVFEENKLTDLKLLDLVMWSIGETKNNTTKSEPS